MCGDPYCASCGAAQGTLPRQEEMGDANPMRDQQARDELREGLMQRAMDGGPHAPVVSSPFVMLGLLEMADEREWLYDWAKRAMYAMGRVAPDASRFETLFEEWDERNL